MPNSVFKQTAWDVDQSNAKRFESRYDVLNEETHLALEKYQMALLTKNAVLLACSESVIQQIAGPEVVTHVFGRSVMPMPATQSASIRPAVRKS